MHSYVLASASSHNTLALLSKLALRSIRGPSCQSSMRGFFAGGASLPSIGWERSSSEPAVDTIFIDPDGDLGETSRWKKVRTSNASRAIGRGVMPRLAQSSFNPCSLLRLARTGLSTSCKTWKSSNISTLKSSTTSMAEHPSGAPKQKVSSIMPLATILVKLVNSDGKAACKDVMLFQDSSEFSSNRTNACSALVALHVAGSRDEIRGNPTAMDVCSPMGSSCSVPTARIGSASSCNVSSKRFIAFDSCR
mmetsp:Transcript_8930/g.20874  ORF Transcript_8930/g.20874 Transcript_8930/m.20874 type:complete len:250 (-) Transcript_8930:277-1026(-)